MNFIDLFAGIGGFRLGFEKEGYNCVFSSEIDEECQKIYEKNYGEKPHGDIYDIDLNQISDFDVLLGGFPCQPFSSSGKQKGFEDTRGTLFFKICEIIEEKKPKIIVLENVKNLINHDNKNTIKVIINCLENLGYYISYKVLNAKDFGVPQNRERVIIICKNKEHYNKPFNFDLIDKFKVKKEVVLRDFLLDSSEELEILEPSDYTIIDTYKKQKSGLIFIGYRNRKIRVKGVRAGTEHLSRVHKQPNRIYSVDGVNPTLSALESSGRYFIYIPEKKLVRKLTLKECYKIMGFPEDFILSQKKSQAYKQVGNSVCVKMIEAISKAIKLEETMKETTMEETTMDYSGRLNSAYNYSKMIKEDDDIFKEIPTLIKKDIKTIGQNSNNYKGVFTVLVTLALYKSFHPEQDIRYHQTSMSNGFSGRSFDTKYVTPVLKGLEISSMNESGWLTRSLEQPKPYTKDYEGKIQKVKAEFLTIVDYIESNEAQADKILMLILVHGIETQKKLNVKINPLNNPEKLTIENIMNLLEQHFEWKYNQAGGSKLPVIAYQAIYSIIVNEIGRYSGCSLKKLGSHTASDNNSRASGDIEVLDENGSVYEAIEIKYGKQIDELMVRNAMEKIYLHNPKRYYILSTIDYKKDIKIEELINQVKTDHGCQIIVNGLIRTIKYYLRLLDDPAVFLNIYGKMVSEDTELKLVHKQILNNLISKL